MDPPTTRTESHEQAVALIPWLVNGTLAPEAVCALRAHIAECLTCRKDYESQHRWYESMCAQGSLVFAAEPSFQKLMSRLESSDEESLTSVEHPTEKAHGPELAVANGRSSVVRRGFGAHRWLTAAVVLQAIALGAGGWLWHVQRARTDAPYATLTSASPSYATGPRVRVVFRSDLSLGVLKSLLQTLGAHVVDGPTEANVYTLGFAQPVPDTRELQARIASLRANPSVLFAEPALPDNSSP